MGLFSSSSEVVSFRPSSRSVDQSSAAMSCAAPVIHVELVSMRAPRLPITPLSFTNRAVGMSLEHVKQSCDATLRRSKMNRATRTDASLIKVQMLRYRERRGRRTFEL